MKKNKSSHLRQIDLSAVPAVVLRFLHAHRVHDSQAAIGAFKENAMVEDDDKTYVGRAAIEGWLNRTSSQYTYTIEAVGAQQSDDNHYVIVNHLEGDFPGGKVDLRYQFELENGLIKSLIIEA